MSRHFFLPPNQRSVTNASPRVDHRLIDTAYRAVTSPDGWRAFLEESARAGRFQSTVVGFHHQGYVVVGDTAHGIDAPLLDEFDEVVSAESPLNASAQILSPGWHHAPAERIVSADVFRRSSYKDWIARTGGNDLICTLDKDRDGGVVSFGFFTPRGHSVTRDQERFLDQLAPHLTHAIALTRTLAERSSQLVLSREALQRREGAILTIHGDGRIEWASARAVALIEAHPRLGIVDGRLTIDDAAMGRNLRRALQPQRDAVPPPFTARMPGPPVVELSCTPLRLLEHELLGPRLGALLVLTAVDPFVEAWRTLPPSLREVADALTLGLSDKEIAARLGKPLATVRTYARRVYVRLGVSSRRELMKRHEVTKGAR